MQHKFNLIFNSKSGFTLIELLLVVGLLALSVGVAGDIIITLIRSYNKTQITNEIEQNGNFVLNKLENELRGAQYVDTPSTIGDGGAGNTLVFVQNVNGSEVTITYSVQNGTLTRTYDTGSGSPPAVALTNDDAVKGVTVSCPSNLCFTLIGQDPDVVLIRLSFQNVGGSGIARPFTGSMDVESTIVLRGSY